MRTFFSFFEKIEKKLREGTQLGVDAMASVATFGHIGKQACRCDTHLLTLAKAARSPPCTLPFLAQAPTLRFDHSHTSMAAALTLTGCGRRSILKTLDEYL